MRLPSLFPPSLTVILVSRFIINLQEASLRHIKVDSDDPLYLSTHSDDYRPSFVEAAPVVAHDTGNTPQTPRFGVHRVPSAESSGSGGAGSNGACRSSFEMEG